MNMTLIIELETINAKNNYSYDEIGQLIKDSAEQIQSITWNVHNKIKKITRYSGSNKQNLIFDYDVNDNRIAKHVYTSSNVWQKSTYYIRDAQGNVMATWKNGCGSRWRRSSFSGKPTTGQKPSGGTKPPATTRNTRCFEKIIKTMIQ